MEGDRNRVLDIPPSACYNGDKKLPARCVAVNPLSARLWGKLLEPKTQVEPSRQPFSNQDLKQLIVPLFVEQLLAMLVGIADTLMVSYAGEAAVSGVSLVNMLNTFFIFLFTALASGGAVVVSQYIGSRDGANSNLAAGQLYTLSFLFSLVCMAATLVWNRPLLGLLFGQVEPDVMEASAIYLRISAYSYPFLALYNAGAALYRCMSKTKVTMQISLVMNAINVAGNAIGIFVLHAGVAGVAWPSTLSRAFAAVAMTALCFSQKNQVRLLWKNLLTWNSSMVRRLLRIAVPNSIENGLFQLAKVALSSITAMFGTAGPVGSPGDAGERAAGRNRCGAGGRHLAGHFPKAGGDKLAAGPQENHQKEGGPLGAHFVLRPVGTAVRGPSPCGQPLFGVGLQRPRNRRPWRGLSLLGMAVCPGGAASLSGCAGWDFLHL